MSPATAHWAIVYPVWALTICAMTLPGLLLGLLAERVRHRHSPAYLGEWSGDYDVLAGAQLVNEDQFAGSQLEGLEALRKIASR